MLTRSEIFNLAKKATRGAGYSWGMAEEAALATLRLCCAGHDGFAVLEKILKNADKHQHPMPIQSNTPVCGLTYGVYIADRGEKIDMTMSIIGREMALAIINAEIPTGTMQMPESAPQSILDYAHRTYVPESEESRLRGAG